MVTLYRRLQYESQDSGSEAERLEGPLALRDLRGAEGEREAFYKLVMLYHPDKGGDAEKCKEVIAAWTVLKSKLA